MLKAATKLDARYFLAITDDDDEKVKNTYYLEIQQL